MKTDLNNAKEKMANLRRKIDYHDFLYFVKNEPEIGDYEYDEIYRSLKKLEEKYPDLKEGDSPTGNINYKGEIIDKFVKIRHKSKMLSLEKAFTNEELFSFKERVEKNTGKKRREYVAQLKIDGLALSLIYKNGELVQAITRGDGETGDDVTHNAKTINSIPKTLPSNIDIEIRGEVYMKKTKLLQINSRRKENFEKPFVNERNAAAGSLRQLDSEKCRKRPLSFMAFSYYSNDLSKVSIEKYTQVLKDLLKMGFEIPHQTFTSFDFNEIINHCSKFNKIRDDFNYGIDGMVIKVNSLKEQQELSNTNKYPRWAIAYKFSAKQSKTIVEDIKVTVGRTGTLTPNAILKPVFIDGSTVGKASLHNFEQLQEKDIRIGDKVILQKAGDIIPEVVKSLKEDRDGSEIKFEKPTSCPVCNSSVKHFEKEVALTCTNINCLAKLEGNLEHFASRKNLNINGLGEAIVKQLIANDLIKDIADIFYLKKEDLLLLKRMGEKSANNLLEAIEESKKVGPQKVLSGLGFKHIGQTVSEILFKKYDSFDELIKLCQPQGQVSLFGQEKDDEFAKTNLLNLEGLGEKIVESLINNFQNEENLKIIKKLKEAGVALEKKEEVEEEKEDNSLLDGMKIVMTGSLENYTRKEMKDEISKRGGKVTGSVSGKTDLLLAGKNAGSKLKKAESKNVRIVNEEEFIQEFLINDN